MSWAVHTIPQGRGVEVLPSPPTPVGELGVCSCGFGDTLRVSQHTQRNLKARGCACTLGIRPAVGERRYPADRKQIRL